ncbi:MAG TPA: HEAT repeat domain-containing protein, partial [Planctomycetota bacterium]|nr:HEAT repeat domain-containing protein [Planctomycetota bacterium]
DALPGLVDDPAASVRTAAIAACARLKLEAAAPTVAARFDDEDPDVRVASVTAFSKLRPFEVRTVDRAVAAEDCPWARRRMELMLRK